MAGPEDADGYFREMATNWPEAYGSDYIVDYNVRAPWRMNLSAGYTFANILALDACFYSLKTLHLSFEYSLVNIYLLA